MQAWFNLFDYNLIQVMAIFGQNEHFFSLTIMQAWAIKICPVSCSVLLTTIF